jgi:ATP-dependent exoDNAse (exonuclease V) beta subunit
VAATRAREKLIVSGHVRRLTSGLRWAGWLGALAAATGLDQAEVGEELAEPVELRLAAEWAGAEVRATLHPPTPPTALPSATHVPTPPTPPTTAAPSATHVPDLVAPLAEVVAQRVAGGARAAARETAPPDRVWRVTPGARRPGGPSWVVGLLVHQALRRWRFPQPGGEAFEAFLRPFALDAGLTAPAEIAAALREARRLVERFGAHPLRAEMEASPRRHEVAYALAGDRGVIDVVYRGPRGWTAADFKTDELRSERELREAIARHGYDAQVRRYCQAWEAQSVQRPRGLLVFLSVAGEVRVAEVESERGG